jgi:hypothetical protein
LVEFIQKYEEECLIKCLGYSLAHEFLAELDTTKTNGLKETADSKWDDLLNGKSYTNPDGEEVIWKGIRFKNLPTADKPNRSFLANYVYWFYEQGNVITVAGIGSTKQKSKNSVIVNKTPNVVRAWREMVEMIQGKPIERKLLVNRFGYGVDYYNGGNVDVNLYKFIIDMNELTPDTYQNFKRYYWDIEQQNQFGL